MLNAFIRATSGFTRRRADQPTAWLTFARDTLSGFVTTAHHLLLLLGIIAIGALGLMFVRPEMADHIKEISPFVEADAAPEELASTAPAANGPLAMQPAALPSTSPAATPTVAGSAEKSATSAIARQQRRVSNWISKRYRVANDATHMLVSAAYQTAKEIKLDPLLILSVAAIESGFNPFAESPVGAQGLMQVMSKVHHDKFQGLGGVKAALNPVANIRVGALILKDYVTRGGSVEAGLKMYVGAGAMESDFGYGAKVLAEYRRLKDVAMGKRVPVYATSASTAKPAAAESKSPAPAEQQASDHPSPAEGSQAPQVAAL